MAFCGVMRSAYYTLQWGGRSTGFIEWVAEMIKWLMSDLVDAEHLLSERLNELKSEVRKGLNYADEDPVGFMHRLFGVPYFGGRMF
ncbi:hypothetical protein M5M_06100 [Simiduia agarivorans SA1 = DSM 21679]|uniref:Uncharacterized protein n=1 Tax=Simiduia agarivorans (strain DSM 21679 / JCM 13881 / BCRC 17597 / SA1) TaxID=1117647 RepID=K4KJL5_SIMAS|nr:hypothetical protein M5M_06100 [Simiduia agarivorans SA1 = DSM 21679]